MGTPPPPSPPPSSWTTDAQFRAPLLKEEAKPGNFWVTSSGQFSIPGWQPLRTAPSIIAVTMRWEGLSDRLTSLDTFRRLPHQYGVMLPCVFPTRLQSCMKGTFSVAGHQAAGIVPGCPLQEARAHFLRWVRHHPPPHVSSVLYAFEILGDDRDRLNVCTASCYRFFSEYSQ